MKTTDEIVDDILIRLLKLGGTEITEKPEVVPTSLPRDVQLAVGLTIENDKLLLGAGYLKTNPPVDDPSSAYLPRDIAVVRLTPDGRTRAILALRRRREFWIRLLIGTGSLVAGALLKECVQSLFFRSRN